MKEKTPPGLGVRPGVGSLTSTSGGIVYLSMYVEVDDIANTVAHSYTERSKPLVDKCNLLKSVIFIHVLCSLYSGNSCFESVVDVELLRDNDNSLDGTS